LSTCYSLNLQCLPKAQLLKDWFTKAVLLLGDGGTFERWGLLRVL
jgi:hypothetical protein